MNEVYELEKIIGVKLKGAEFKGKNICSCCLTSMKRSLNDIPSNFDWANRYREKFKAPNTSICNQCSYHLILLLIVGLDSDVIDVNNFVKAYNVTMNLEKVFFQPKELSLSSIVCVDSFEELERMDENQSLYCQTFNNAYDLVQSGGFKSYFQSKNWPEVLTYRRGRFNKMSSKEKK